MAEWGAIGSCAADSAAKAHSNCVERSMRGMVSQDGQGLRPWISLRDIGVRSQESEVRSQKSEDGLLWPRDWAQREQNSGCGSVQRQTKGTPRKVRGFR